jgi:signal transduction histidine kinase
MHKLILLKVESDAARQRFIRYVFHELRVPFNSINMALDLLLEEEGHTLSASGNETLCMAIQV